MTRSKGGVPARLGWLAVILGIGILGCAVPEENLESCNPASAYRNGAQDQAGSSRPDILRTSYHPTVGPKNEDSNVTPASCPMPLAPAGASFEPHPPLPTELAMTTLPSYIIEPPDLLNIEAIRIVPKPPYHIEPLDVLAIEVNETLPNHPIGTIPYPVCPDGTVNLGHAYGMVRVAGMTLEEASQSIQQHLRRRLTNPVVSVALSQCRGIQQTRGKHLVQMDGCISLGSYGCVPVTGLTVAQAKCAIETHLSHWLLDPEISLSVAAFNSKVYYVILDGGRSGEQVFRLPITGKDTVLDAISHINGLPPMCSTRKIWVARPTPAGKCCYQILPVNWRVLTAAGDSETNYQLFPGDRVYVRVNSLMHCNTWLPQALCPFHNASGW